MNIHHLELFYYVAEYGGIREGVRHIPYGIQQPAVSAQILQLEDALGVKLFVRRPFQLTPEGRELYRFIAPFFANLGSIEDRIKGEPTEWLRLAGSKVALRDYLPEALTRLRERSPRFKVAIREGTQAQVERWLQDQEIDIGVTLIVEKPPTNIKAEIFLKLSFALLVPESTPITDPIELLGQDRIAEKLIALPPSEPLTRIFQRQLSKRRIDWPIGIEVNSLDLIETYVVLGFGIGVGVVVPGRSPIPGLRALPLPDFPELSVGAMWRHRLNPVGNDLLEELRLRARRMKSQGTQGRRRSGSGIA